MHLLLDYTVNHITSFILNLSVKGIAKLKPYCVRQATPMTPEILLHIASFFWILQIQSQLFIGVCFYLHFFSVS